MAKRKPKKENKVAKEVVKTLTKGKETKKDKLLSLIPEGHSPKVYLDLVKSQVLGVDRDGENRPDEDLMFFLYTAKRTGLDPLVNQIYAVYRWDSRLGREKMTIQTGIDGFRLVAQRSGDYAGQDDASFIPEDESSQYPVKASVTVYKVINGTRVPFTATARWSEYVQLGKNGKPTSMWSKMPYLMLSKCAEALALRKAFPNELSGIYTEAEMGQSTNMLADLPAPDKFKQGEPQVEFGAPEETRPEMKTAEPAEDKGKGASRAKESKTKDDVGSPEADQVTKDNKEKKPKNDKVKEYEPDISKMRAKIKKMQDRQKKRDAKKSKKKKSKK